MPNVCCKLVSSFLESTLGAKACLIHSNLSCLLFVLVILLLGRHDDKELNSFGGRRRGRESQKDVLDNGTTECAWSYADLCAFGFLLVSCDH